MKLLKNPTTHVAWIAAIIYFGLELICIPLFLLFEGKITRDWLLLFTIFVSTTGTLVYMSQWFKKRSLRFYFPNRTQNPVSYPLLIVAIIMLVIGVIVPIISLFPFPYQVILFYEQTVWNTSFASFVLVVIASPILDELIFRGLILRGFAERYQVNFSITISALFYGMVHLNPWFFVVNFILGIFLGWVYSKSKSIIPGMFIHAVLNLLVFLFNFFLGTEESLRLFTTGLFESTTTTIVVTTVCLVVFVFCIYMLRGIYRDDEFIDWDLYQ